MTLTAEQREKRKGRLTASRVAVLMTGDREGILRLYQEMIGELAEEDLSNVWPVQLGAVTEQLNLDWYEKKQGSAVTRRGLVLISKEYDWAAATLDGWDVRLACPVECKHVGGREPFEVVLDRYQPQMQWQMFITNARSCAFSVIMGANEPVVEYVDRHEPYITEMVSRAEHFMMCVALRQPPVELPSVAPPGDPTKVINMTGNNQWADQAVKFLENQGPAEVYEGAKKGLKDMMPPNAKRAFGHGVYVLRDRANRLHVREEKKGDYQ